MLALLILLVLVLVLVPFFLSPQPCGADRDSFSMGVGEFQQQHFSKAADIFEGCIAAGSQNDELYYYTAITYERLGDYKKALDRYTYVLSHFPKTEAGRLSLAAIDRPAFQQILYSKGINQPVRASALDIYPKETWVDFIRNNNTIMVEGSINNIPTKMVFDTGASSCVFTLDQLDRLGIAPPHGPPTAMTFGVGSTAKVPVWSMKVDLKLGKIERKNFPIIVSPAPLSYPLLGENFYHDLKYTIDNENKTIAFKCNSEQTMPLPLTTAVSSMTVSSNGNYVYNVPFIIENRALVVVAHLNGRECQMIFDTGADVCVFTYDQLDKLQIKPKRTGQVMNLKGTSGLTQAQVYIIDKAELGPISRAMPCLVTDQAMVPRPLLGQTFFKDWQYTIDHVHNVIQFTER